MALMLGQLHDALRAGNVPDDKARAAAEEVASYRSGLTKFRLGAGALPRMGERLDRIESDLRVLKWMTGFLLVLTSVRSRWNGKFAKVTSVMTDAIKFTLDGREVEARPGETIWQVAKREGIDIPHLCWLPEPGYRADGNCRACMVEIEGERVLAASCIRKPTAGMKVVTASDRRRPRARWSWNCCSPTSRSVRSPIIPIQAVAVGGSHGRARLAFPARDGPTPDLSHPAMAVHLDACIHCNLCACACREVQVNDVIGMAYRNIGSKIVFDMDDPMGGSTCVACGECVQACPTGALMPSSIVDEQGVGHPEVDRRVDSVCPYCGVGCQITYHIKDDRIRYVTGRNGPANENRLCVKGASASITSAIRTA